MQTIQLKNGKNPVDKDPYLLYGFGIIAYFDLITMMMILFSVLTLLNLPALFIYSSYSGIQYQKGYSSMMLGNFGESSSQCVASPISTGSIFMTCPTGVISSVYQPGLISRNDVQKDTCYFTGNETCAQDINSKALIEDFLYHCKGLA